MFPAISLLQLREAAESVSVSSASSPSTSSSPPPALSFTTDGNTQPFNLLPPLPVAPVSSINAGLIPFCLSTAICLRVHSVLSRPSPSEEEKARANAPIFSPGTLRVGIELRRQSVLTLAPSLPIFHPSACTETTHVGSFAFVVHLDTNKLSSSCVVRKTSLKCVEVRTLLACVADMSNGPPSPLSTSLPVTLLFRPQQPTTPLNLLTVRTAANAPTRDCVQLSGDSVYECEIVVQCDSEDGMMQQTCEASLEVLSVELCHGPNMVYVERLHWWPALGDTQRHALLPWVMSEATSKERRPRSKKGKEKERSEHKHKRKHTGFKRHHAHKHKRNGSHKQSRHVPSVKEGEDEAEEEEKEQRSKVHDVSDSLPKHKKNRATSSRSSIAPSPLSSSVSPSSSPYSSSPSLVPSSPSSSTMRYPPCCACGYRTTCSRSKFCRCVAAGQRCVHCASDFCENNPKTKPYQRNTIVSRQVVQQYQRAMKQHSGSRGETDKEEQRERRGVGERMDEKDQEREEKTRHVQEKEERMEEGKQA